MPWGDRTGPEGFGPRSGRGLGYCSGYGRPGYMHPGPGRGMRRGYGPGYASGYGRGFGRGYGYRHFAYAQPYAGYNYDYNPAEAKKNEMEYLKDAAEDLSRELDAIHDRIDELTEEE